MGRAIAAVVVGYVFMALVVFASLTAAYIALGTEGAFQPGSYEISTTWIAVGIAVGLVAGILGGLVCALVARSGLPPKALAVLVLALGIVFALPVATGAKEDPGPRPGDVALFDAIQKAQPPAWVVFLNPVIGVVGVLIGAGLRKRKG